MERFKSKFISFITSYSSDQLSISIDDVRERFKEFDRNYKGVGWGQFYSNKVSKVKHLDLIESIGFHYIKGPHTTFILEYRIIPAKKFIKKFLKLLTAENQENKHLTFNNVKEFQRSKRVLKGVSSDIFRSSSLLKRLVQDLNYQVKSKVGKKLAVGYYENFSDHLYPCISFFEMDNVEYLKHSKEFHEALGINEWDSFKTERDDLILNLPPINLSKKSHENLVSIFLNDNKNKKSNSQEDHFDNPAYLSYKYVQSLAPIWCTLNFAGVFQDQIISQRRTTYRYFKKNKDSLFLKEAIKLKYKISKSYLDISVVYKDYKEEVFKNHLNVIPDAYRVMLKPQDEFKKTLWTDTGTTIGDVLLEFKQLKELFAQISEDNVTRSNMKLQRILLKIAILGLLIALYSTDTQYFNDLIENLINHIWSLSFE